MKKEIEKHFHAFVLSCVQKHDAVVKITKKQKNPKLRKFHCQAKRSTETIPQF